MLMINEKTQKIISIAEKPGNFGIKFHNKGYEQLNLNYIYLPLKVSVDQLETTIQLLGDNFQGCSVSMPHKIKVIEYLNELDESASRTGAVNTILNLNGHLKGFNTDYYGAKTAIEMTLSSIQNEDVLLLGAGGVAQAISYAIKDLGGNLVITNRSREKAQNLAEKVKAITIPWEERNNYYAHLLINATSIGMGIDEIVISEYAVSHFNAIMDVVVSPETKLIKEAKEKKKIVILGKLMTTYQAVKQFEIYTGQKVKTQLIDEMLQNF